MNLKVEIEKHSGFCGGVIRAIGRAERFLDSDPEHHLYSLGAIVHNEAELGRLQDKGLETIGIEDLDSIGNPQDKTVLIRAHGEPPTTYSKTKAIGIKVIDCTCPVVLRLQESIREAYSKLAPVNGQLIIFGKIGHAEVLGLVGQVDGDAVVIENMAMLQEAIESGRIDLDRPVSIFSQTTKSPSEYEAICNTLREKATKEVTVHNTICSQVASRHSELKEFASTHDVVIFVSGASSSNGKVLCDLCRSRNERTYHISGIEELRKEWFNDGESVGICGATSTPRWLLDKTAAAVEGL